MIANILIAALLFAWFLFVGYLAIRVFEKEFSVHDRKREPDDLS
ncbi:MAG: hypothetical protein AB9834_01875 [Lentimicrobium sp.]